MRTLPPVRTEPAGGLVTHPTLYRILTASAISEGAARHRLGGVSVVQIKRGAPTRSERSDDGATLTLWINDASISGQHCTMSLDDGRWRLEDRSSTHGTFVSGRRIQSVHLQDRDLISVGTTFLRFAAADVDLASLPHDLPADASSLHAGFRTLHAPLRIQFSSLTAIARSTLSVWISGPTGCGKELAARAIHDASGRPGAFVAVNCATLTEQLADSELFGYRKGAFSGAVSDKVGLIAASSGGTLFLDEVAELSPNTQARLLRALQEREVRPVGATESIAVDIRLLAATHTNIEERVSAGTFREDLFSRLAGAQLSLPPLARRIEDLGLILAALAERLEAPKLSLTPDAATRCLSYSWPRNIRQLEQTLRRSLAMAPDQMIRSSHLDELGKEPGKEPSPVTPAPAKALSADDEERKLTIVALLKQHGGNVSAVAREMSKGRRQIQRWVERYGIDPSEFA